MNVTLPGRYDRYRVPVYRLLNARGLSPEQLLTQRLDQKHILAQFLVDPSP